MISCHVRISSELAFKNFKNVLRLIFTSRLSEALTVKESRNSVMAQTNDDDLLLGNVIIFLVRRLLDVKCPTKCCIFLLFAFLKQRIYH